MHDVSLGDIVLLNRADGTQTPSIIVQLYSQDSAVLYNFSPGGSGGSPDPTPRGTAVGQWEPRPSGGGE